MKIVVVGAGNAGSLTALHFAYHTDKNVEVELIYDPTIPVQPVGQATIVDAPQFLHETIGFNWYNNNIHATFKSGILYNGWGKKQDEFFHSFSPAEMAMHYCPWVMQEAVLKSGWFKVTEGKVNNLDDIDADYIFDCRGKPKDYSDYDELPNPTNACILGKPKWDLSHQHWSCHTATPDGWTFIIPTLKESPSHDYCVGYCYNSNITSQEDAEKNMLEMFDVEIKDHVYYKNYVAKNPVIDDRIILNGNKLFFIEPMESSSVAGYLFWDRLIFEKIILNNGDMDLYCQEFIQYVKQLQTFILMHYKSGSKYDTPFWNYAESLTYDAPIFESHLYRCRTSHMNTLREIAYGQWPLMAVKRWLNYTE